MYHFLIHFQIHKSVSEQITTMLKKHGCYFSFLEAHDDHISAVQKNRYKLNTDTAVIWIMPQTFCNPKTVQHWPPILIPTDTGFQINSILFEDDFHNRFEQLIRLQPIFETDTMQITAQYDPHYTSLLELWQRIGAVTLHPGDYYKKEVLSAIARTKGVWVYHGHAERDILRGYNHISIKDLKNHQPHAPKTATYWLACATLSGSKKEHSIALNWWEQGATRCLMASSNDVKTKNNKFLTEVIVETIAQTTEPLSTLSLLQKILKRPDALKLADICNEYHLIGLP